MICKVLLEGDSVDIAGAPSFLICGGMVLSDQMMRQRMRNALQRFLGGSTKSYVRTEDFDQEFFGGPLPRRPLDARIGLVVDQIKRHIGEDHSAAECAKLASLSQSRFLHLFRAEVGASLRTYRAWQRARSILYRVTEGASLLDVALDVGYGDAAHFSHAIRTVYGLTPRAIFSGSRRLALRTLAERNRRPGD